MASDLAATFEQLFTTNIFKSFDDFERKFKEYQLQTGSVYRVKSSSSAENENRRRKYPIPSSLRYGAVTFVCVHYGLPKKNGIGLRKKQRYLPSGCESLVSLVARKDYLVIKKKLLVHNHDINPELQRFYAHRRRLSEGKINEIDDVIKLHPGNKQLKNFLQAKLNKALASQEIRNQKHKLRQQNDHSESEELSGVVKDLEGKGKIEVMMDDGALQMIAFATNEMIAMYRQYPEFIFLDRTYRVNKYNYPLYIIDVQDNLGHGQSVFYAFVHTETEDMVTAILSAFRNMMEDTSKTRTVMLDKDQKEIDAVRNALPDANVILCHFHVIKYFKKKVSELSLTAEKKNELFAQLKALVYAKDAESFDSAMNQLAEMNEELHQYISDNWLDCKEMWVTYLRQSTVTFGNDTNNRVETENSRLQHLVSSSSSMSKCIRQLCFCDTGVDDEHQYKQFLGKCTTLEHVNDDEDLSRFYSRFSEHAVKKMLTNHAIPQTVPISVSDICSGIFKVNLGKSERIVRQEGIDYVCTCQFHTLNQLPCRHIIATVRHQEKDLSLLAENSRWLKTDATTPQLVYTASENQILRSPQPQQSVTTALKYQDAQDTVERLTAVLSNCGSASYEEIQAGEKVNDDVEEVEIVGLEAEIESQSNTSESENSNPESESVEETITTELGIGQRKIFVSSKKPAGKRKKCPEDPRIAEAYNILKSVSSAQRDECTIYGELVAHKLRKLDDRSRAIAQHNISNMMFEAEMGKYS